ncbi:tumor necrosis factor receptor superfamily member 10A-like [Equus quagga]|uniref:tumor necrosis factor receptor superfamily member 10A-like n=1 Tax=Equus quagga TaxID=89248 RepID=UPI001EE2A12E|nr:tumor necrosis factor receptor superfamily member 10A-like [Equus quagga]
MSSLVPDIADAQPALRAQTRKDVPVPPQDTQTSSCRVTLPDFSQRQTQRRQELGALPNLAGQRGPSALAAWAPRQGARQVPGRRGAPGPVSSSSWVSCCRSQLPQPRPPSRTEFTAISRPSGKCSPWKGLCPPGSHVSEDSRDCTPCTNGAGHTVIQTPALLVDFVGSLCLWGLLSLRRRSSSIGVPPPWPLQCPLPRSHNVFALRPADGMVEASPCTPWSDLKCVHQGSGTQASGEAPVPGEPVTVGLPTTPSRSSGNPWPVIGIVVGAVAVLLLGLTVYLYRRRILQGEVGGEALTLSASLTPRFVSPDRRALPSNSRTPWSFWSRSDLVPVISLHLPPHLHLTRAEITSVPSSWGCEVDANCMNRVFFWRSCPPRGPEALDNAYNKTLNNRESSSTLVSEQELEGQEQAEPTGVSAQSPGEAERLLGPAGAEGSQMRRRLLVPANGADPTERAGVAVLGCPSHGGHTLSGFPPLRTFSPLSVSHHKLFMQHMSFMDSELPVSRAGASGPQDALCEIPVTWLNSTGRGASVSTLLDAVETWEGRRNTKETIQDHQVPWCAPPFAERRRCFLPSPALQCRTPARASLGGDRSDTWSRFSKLVPFSEDFPKRPVKCHVYSCVHMSTVCLVPEGIFMEA